MHYAHSQCGSVYIMLLCSLLLVSTSCTETYFNSTNTLLYKYTTHTCLCMRVCLYTQTYSYISIQHTHVCACVCTHKHTSKYTCICIINNIMYKHNIVMATFVTYMYTAVIQLLAGIWLKVY